ncbi:hypothetical protein CERSUDRAFT_53612, partial [Gelatoporia subvermispora B]
MSATKPVQHILEILDAAGLTIGSFLNALLIDTTYKDHPLIVDLQDDGGILIEWLIQRAKTTAVMKSWALQIVKQYCMEELTGLSGKKMGMHFNVKRANEEQVQSFDIEALAGTMQNHAPMAWELIGGLLEADPAIAKRRRQKRGKSKRRPIRQVDPIATTGDTDVEVPLVLEEDNNNKYWRDFDEPPDTHNNEEYLLDMDKSVVAIALMLHSTNQRCNTLQAMVGVFLHACNAPEAIIDFLSRIGLSISRSAINTAVTSLSAEAIQEIRKLGRTLLSQSAYDNFDVELRRLVPTVE